MEEWLRQGTPKSVLLVVGVAGCGMSSSLEHLLKSLEIEAVWFGPGATKLRASLLDAGCSCYSATGRRKIVVLDGFDAMMADANAAADIGEFIRRALPAPTIFLTHKTRTIHKRFRELFNAASYAAQASVLDMEPPSSEALATILAAEYPEADSMQIKDIAERARGDVRAAKAALEFSGNSNTLKDYIPEAYTVVDDALSGNYGTVKEILDAASSDPAVISHGIFERYGWHPEISDVFSVADVLDECMFSKQHWELHDVHAALAVAYPALKAPKAKHHAKKSPAKFTYGMVWSKLHLQACRQRHVRTVATQRAEAKLRFLPVQESAYLRRMIMDAHAQGDTETLRNVLHGLKPDGLLSLMRLWRGNYTQSMHSKVSRHCAIKNS